MSKYGGAHFTPILVDGYNLGGYLTDFGPFPISAAMEETHCLGDEWRKQEPVGVRTFELPVSGFYDDTALASHAAFNRVDAAGGVKVLTACPEGGTHGTAMIGIGGAIQASYARIASRGALHKVEAQFAGSGQVDEARVTRALAALSGASGNGTSIDGGPQGVAVDITASTQDDPTEIDTDGPHGLATGDSVIIAGHTSTPDINGEWEVTVTGTDTFTIDVEVTEAGSGGTVTKTSSSAGGAGYVQCTALDLGGYDNLAVTIQHSPDNSTFVDLIEFAVITAAPDAERKVVSGTVQRYVRDSFAYTGSGSGQSATVQTGFARY